MGLSCVILYWRAGGCRFFRTVYIFSFFFLSVFFSESVSLVVSQSHFLHRKYFRFYRTEGLLCWPLQLVNLTVLCLWINKQMMIYSSLSSVYYVGIFIKLTGLPPHRCAHSGFMCVCDEH